MLAPPPSEYLKQGGQKNKTGRAKLKFFFFFMEPNYAIAQHTVQNAAHLAFCAWFAALCDFDTCTIFSKKSEPPQPFFLVAPLTLPVTWCECEHSGSAVAETCPELWGGRCITFWAGLPNFRTGFPNFQSSHLVKRPKKKFPFKKSWWAGGTIPLISFGGDGPPLGRPFFGGDIRYYIPPTQIFGGDGPPLSPPRSPPMCQGQRCKSLYDSGGASRDLYGVFYYLSDHRNLMEKRAWGALPGSTFW